MYFVLADVLRGYAASPSSPVVKKKSDSGEPALV